MTDVIWYLEDNELAHDDLATAMDYEFINPLPSIWWSVEDNTLTTAILSAHITHDYIIYPFPFDTWYVNEENMLTHTGLPEIPKTGAFMNCLSLSVVSIPESVKYIGPYAFANTVITNVKIASDCVYSTTSFPSGCIINFYP